MFQIVKEPLGEFNKYILSNKSTGEYASIIPEFGANVNEIVLRKGEKLHSVIAGNTDYEELIANQWYQGAKLLPYVNRIKDGKYKFDGNLYQFDLNQAAEGHSIHGLLYNKEYLVSTEYADDKNCFIVVEYKYEGKEAGFPFKFDVKLKFSLSDEGFDYSTQAINTSDIDMPFGDGWHPYFTLNEAVESLKLSIPKSKRLVVDERMIPTKEILEDTSFSELNTVGDSMLDTGFLLNEIDAMAVSTIYSEKQDLSLNFYQKTGENKYNFLQVFIPPSRDRIALEPMTCAADSFNNKIGLIVLKPNQIYSASCGVYLS